MFDLGAGEEGVPRGRDAVLLGRDDFLAMGIGTGDGDVEYTVDFYMR